MATYEIDRAGVNMLIAARILVDKLRKKRKLTKEERDLVEATRTYLEE